MLDSLISSLLFRSERPAEHLAGVVAGVCGILGALLAQEGVEHAALLVTAGAGRAGVDEAQADGAAAQLAEGEATAAVGLLDQTDVAGAAEAVVAEIEEQDVAGPGVGGRDGAVAVAHVDVE